MKTNTVNASTVRPQYLTQINAFNRFTECYYLPQKAQLLWFKLIHLCNSCGWPEWIQVDSLRIMQWIGARDVKSAYRARDALVDAGLLEYEKGHKGCPNRYRFRYFPDDPYGETGTKTTRNDTENDSKKGIQYGTHNKTR